MALDEHQLSVVLQASLEHARELLEEAGGFLPFGARAKPDGEIEFLEAAGAAQHQPVEALRHQIAAMLTEDARRKAILGSALVANASLPSDIEPGFDTAIAVLVEAADFCRSIIVPYRLTGETTNGGHATVQFGRMIPEEADPIVFAD